MSDPTAAAKLRSRCNDRLGGWRVPIAERDTGGTVESGWPFSSWARARGKRATRLVRRGRDEH